MFAGRSLSLVRGVGKEKKGVVYIKLFYFVVSCESSIGYSYKVIIFFEL